MLFTTSKTTIKGPFVESLFTFADPSGSDQSFSFNFLQVPRRSTRSHVTRYLFLVIQSNWQMGYVMRTVERMKRNSNNANINDAV